MPEADKEGERYAVDQPQQTPGFFLKGTHQLDWGMKNRMARVFDPVSGRTVMLAIDHGYFQGPTTGLERIDLSIVPLLPNCDALFCTRGILRSVIPAECQKPMVLRASGGPSILREELSDEQIAMDMDDAMRLNAAGVGIQVFIGGEFETRSVHNMTKLVDAGLRMGIPVMGITAVGKTMVRDAKYFRLACRIIAELGAQYVKTYYVDEGFRDHHRVVPGADRDGRRQEAARARGADHGLQRRAAGRLRRRHGPQHFPVRGAAGDDRRRRRRGAQEHEAEGRARPVQYAEGKRRNARCLAVHPLRRGSEQEPGDNTGRQRAAERGQYFYEPGVAAIVAVVLLGGRDGWSGPCVGGRVRRCRAAIAARSRLSRSDLRLGVQHAGE